ncbi:MAG TPA: hypothetical protein VMN58_08050 [Acidimicrobiales bacterium]|nr:hypothetical protein [Acidimicrobiales bacterium]
MSSIWTPGGERPVPRPGDAPQQPPAADPAGAPGAAPTTDEEAQVRAEMEAMERELASTPAAVVIANHAVGLFQLAAIHLNQRPPQLDDGRLAIDALAALLDSVSGRLGDDETALRQGLDQLRMAFVQLAGTEAPDEG